MRTRTLPLALAAAMLGLGTACDSPQATPEQTLALRQAQTRTFEVPLETVFKAAMAFLQDNTYQIRQANRQDGMINAYKLQDLSAGKKFWGQVLAGQEAKKGDQYDLTLTFDAIDADHTAVRCNITHGQTNIAGRQQDVSAVTDLGAYKQVMDGLTLEVQRRHLTTTMNATAPTK
jgi:hypothetical protein